jgi:phage terminase large subunit-like protein
MTNENNISSDSDGFVPKMVNDEAFRREVTSQSMFWFSRCYFGTSLRYETPEFHKEIFSILESDFDGVFVISAFRGAGKSTIAYQYVLFEILARQKKKFIIIASRTQRQAEVHLANIRYILENPDHKLFQLDLGPFWEESDEWGKRAIIIPKYAARIAIASSEQSLRGAQHNGKRPDILLFDDLEDNNSVRTKEEREKIFNWLNRDAIPAGDQDTRILILGTPLHGESVLMQMKREVEEKRREGLVRFYPIVDERGECAWSAKFGNAQQLEKLARTYDHRAWKQEFMLQIVTEEYQPIQREWIRYYLESDKQSRSGYRFTVISVDPAFSKEDGADYTAIVTGDVYGRGETLRVYIRPNPVCQRFTGLEIVSTISRLYCAEIAMGHSPRVVLEATQGQQTLVELLAQVRIIAKAVRPSEEKSVRLTLAGSYVQGAHVFFAEKGNELLLTQILNFGLEKHDDLADAFSQLLISLPDSLGKGFTVPTPRAPLPKDDPAAMEELNHKADLEVMRQSEYERSSYDPAMRPGPNWGGSWGNNEKPDQERKYVF